MTAGASLKAASSGMTSRKSKGRNAGVFPLRDDDETVRRSGRDDESVVVDEEGTALKPALSIGDEE
jgi:hypothetical protein